MNAFCHGWNGVRQRRLAAAIISALCLAATISGFSQTPNQAPKESDSSPSPSAVAQMEARVAEASRPARPWDGPTTGPEGQQNKTIAIISEDLRNGGILGVAEGIYEATKAMKWTVKVFDAAGTPAGRGKAAADALAAHPDGVILVGGDAKEMQSRLNPFAERGVPIVGWHVGPKPGPMLDNPVAINVSTDPLEVAKVAAMAAVVAAEGHANVVIFTDSNFEIAMTKANVMAGVIRECKSCTLLEVRDVAISKSSEQMPDVTADLLVRYGKRWNYALAINDIYFDYAAPALTKAGRTAGTMNLLSAGDGSAAAFMRIRAKLFQTATVAEPLNLHGWQLVDELNRLLAHQPVSGYVAPVHLVTPKNIMFDGGPHMQYDPDNGYRNIYRRIWKR